MLIKKGWKFLHQNFANDLVFSYNHSYDPVTEYLSFFDNGDFSVDGVLSDFPITPSAAADCFSHLGNNASKKDGVDIIDCPVQMSKDGIPLCLSSINLIDSTDAAQSSFSNLAKSIPIIRGSGIFTFSLELGKTFKPCTYAAYLAENEGIGATDAVITALKDAGYDNRTTLKVMIQSTNSSVLTKFKNNKNYELVYKVDESIRDALNSTVEDIKEFAHSVVVNKDSVFPENNLFLTGFSQVVPKLQAFNLSDATEEINTYYQSAGVNGIITEFPSTADRYRKNLCLNLGNSTPMYMSPVQPGSLFQLITTPYLPPAEAPNPLLTEADVIEPPLPPVTDKQAPSPGGGGTAAAPTQPNGQPKIAAGIFSSLVTLLASLLLF
ncbi:hypothetical protein Patl1_04048 [Pistacia atlantica]|uniref:Uncharacterized protein n=1 Tax=Pistacia atlantica TaxID=434234 RepID=A0ACC1BTF4_9ROSI|nr:hypothetical protein Patl1_04048 [Pistacia atlantica]